MHYRSLEYKLMGKKNIHICILCMGIFVLCLELYMVKQIQTVEKVSGSFWANVWKYFEEPILLIPFIVTALVIIYSFCVIINAVTDKSDKESGRDAKRI